MRLFLPVFEGRMSLPSIPHDFASRLAERVRTGLLVPGSRRRANYAVQSENRDRIAFRAATFSTAIAVGLNDVVVERRDSTTLSYRVRFWRWTLYGVSLCAVIFVALAIGGLVWERKALDAHPYNPLLFWVQLGFWGLAWPWILTAVHKRFAARCLERILREVLQAPPPA